jgi:hypothetical protein
VRERKDEEIARAPSDAQAWKRAAAEDAGKRLQEGKRKADSYAAQRKKSVDVVKAKE